MASNSSLPRNKDKLMAAARYLQEEGLQLAASLKAPGWDQAGTPGDGKKKGGNRHALQILSL